MHGVCVDLHHGLAVLEVVRRADGGGWQAAGLAHRHEARIECVRDRTTENETARLDPGNELDIVLSVLIGDRIDSAVKCLRITEHAADVAENDARSGEIRNLADERAQPFAEALTLDHLGRSVSEARRATGAVHAPLRECPNA